MPIYEYKCQKCGAQFELLVRTGQKPVCPTCGSKKLEKMISGFCAPKATGRSKHTCCCNHEHTCHCGGNHCHCR